MLPKGRPWDTPVRLSSRLLSVCALCAELLPSLRQSKYEHSGSDDDRVVKVCWSEGAQGGWMAEGLLRFYVSINVYCVWHWDRVNPSGCLKKKSSASDSIWFLIKITFSSIDLVCDLFFQQIKSSICLLRGKIYDALDNRTLATYSYKEALKLDVYCFEAFDLLTSHHMLTAQEGLDTQVFLCLAQLILFFFFFWNL